MSNIDVAFGPVISRESRNVCGGFQNREDSFIWVHLNDAGSIVPLKISKFDSTETVRLKILACKMLATKNQKLKELIPNDSTVLDYDVRQGKISNPLPKNHNVLLIGVTTCFGSEYEFRVYRYRNVAYLKRRLASQYNEKLDIFCRGEKLNDDLVVRDICNHNESTIRLLAKPKARSVDEDDETQLAESENFGSGVLWEPRFDSASSELNDFVKKMVTTTFEGLARGKSPVISSEGSGGCYFMKDPDSDAFVSIFKPTDEEPNAENNPRGLTVVKTGEGLKIGTRVGQGAFREVAAFVLDHPIKGPRKITGFAGVPPTVLVKLLHHSFHHPKGFRKSLECTKLGSLQMFVKSDGSCEDVGPAFFPVEEIHKISVFDIRMANADRHAGNILMSKQEGGEIKLIPIDHGYCLPESFEDCTFEWLNWPQSHQPYSAEVVEYVKSLDAEADIALLRSCGCGLSVKSARTFRLSTMLLKKGVDLGLTPFEIGQFMCRIDINKESAIEQIVNEVESSSVIESKFLETASKLMDEKLVDLST